MDPIYKVARQREWDEALDSGAYGGSPDDIRDGFIHFSTAAQLAGTLEKHFAAERGLVLLTVEPRRLGPALRWEASRRGEKFPHLYRPLRVEEVRAARPVTDADRRSLSA